MGEKILMSKEQIKRAHVLRSYNEGMLSRDDAATNLGISQRQVTRLAKGVKNEGERALIHKNTGRKPSRTLPEELKAEILKIRKKGDYKDCNVKHFQELLKEHHGIIVSYTPLYLILKEGGIESPKKHRKTKAHRRRKRRACAGELIQIDATPYDWFGDGVMRALHGGIDDATSMLTGLYITENECLQGYFEITGQTILNYGTPLSMYSDKHTIFRSPLTEKKAEMGLEANLTQYGRALDELGVNIIYAHSAQAKGRIERLWDTLQSRLPVEFRLRNIKTVEEANVFLAVYIHEHNKKFAVEAEGNPIFVPYNRSESLDDILCIKEERKMDAAGTFSYNSRFFKVLDEGYPLIPAKAAVEVLANIHRGLHVRYKGRVYDVTEIEKPLNKPRKVKHRNIDVEAHVKPHLTHSSDNWKKIWHFEQYEDTMEFLYEVFLIPITKVC
jgi:transposase